MKKFTRDYAKKSYNNDNYNSKSTYTNGDVLGICLLLLAWGGIAVKIIIEAGK